jgi:hypothetical protein
MLWWLILAHSSFDLFICLPIDGDWEAGSGVSGEGEWRVASGDGDRMGIVNWKEVMAVGVYLPMPMQQQEEISLLLTTKRIRGKSDMLEILPPNQ